MHVAPSLTLPDQLERARTRGELVVFAGAGVSMGPPASLPSFWALARAIADPPVSLIDGEPALDKYLGRAERDYRVQVQERARSILADDSRGHTPLHEYLVGLFGAADRVRLITTNFDVHFTTAAERLFGQDSVPYYVGPALPSGRDFRGIVQLHGSLKQKQDRLVLTDRDFGAAYMAEGWAARFLVGVFAERTILFVGYSLSDPLMQYLMPALPPTKRWYALCEESERETWAAREVVPVTFAARADGDRFGDLNDGMRRWHWYADAPPSDHDRELRRIIAIGPPSSPVDIDYVRARLKTDAGFNTFGDAATDVAWFNWAANEGVLNALTDQTADVGEVARWSDWALKRFCGGDQPPLLRFIRRRSLYLHPRFATALAADVAATEPLPQRPVLRQLVALLVNQEDGSRSAFDHHLWLLEKLIHANFTEEALALLRWLTRVHLEPIESFRAAFEDSENPTIQLYSLTNRLGLNGVSGDIARLLEEHGAALAAHESICLAELGLARLRDAYQLLSLARTADDGIDWLSFGRTAIAPSNQDQSGGAEDALVLLVRVALDHWRVSAPNRLGEFAAKNSTASDLLIRRLALYAFAGCLGSDADDILGRAVSEGWPRIYWLRPELYLVLNSHYGAASEAARESFVAALQNDEWWGPDFDDHQQHARFSLSQLLARLVPASDATHRFAEEQRTTHPEWREQDRDGFLSRVSGGWVGEEPSPISAEQMVEWTPQDTYHRVVAELQEATQGDARDRHYSLHGALQQGMRRDPHWGVEFFLIASADPAAPASVLNAGTWGLRDAECTVDDRKLFLARIAEWAWPDDLTRALGSLIEHWSSNVNGETPSSLLDSLDAVADRIYERARDVDVSDLGEHGWTERAINHPAGNAALTWWRVASARNRVTGTFVLNVEENERSRWKRVADDTTSAGAGARPILGMATDRLGAADYPWAVEHVFSAFDLSAGRDRAAQLWDGRLMQSQWSWTTAAALRPFLPGFLAESATLVPMRSRQLGDWIGLLVVRPSESGFSLSLLHAFIQHASNEAREAFAGALPRHLDGLTTEARVAVWRDILAPYWRDRRTNVPVQLSNVEIVEMLEWIPALPEVAADALIELEATPAEAIEHADRIVWAWRDNNDWLQAHPNEAVRILRWITDRHSISPWMAAHAVPHLEAALIAGADRLRVLAATEALGGLPCPEALALAERLRMSGP